MEKTTIVKFSLSGLNTSKLERYLKDMPPVTTFDFDTESNCLIAQWTVIDRDTYTGGSDPY